MIDQEVRDSWYGITLPDYETHVAGPIESEERSMVYQFACKLCKYGNLGERKAPEYYQACLRDASRMHLDYRQHLGNLRT